MLRIRNNRRVCYVLSYFCSMSMLHMFVRYMHTLYEIIHLHHWRRFMHKTLILTSYVHACIITIFKVWNIPIDGYLLSWHAMKIKWPKINLLIFVYSSSINKNSFLQFILKLSQIAFFFKLPWPSNPMGAGLLPDIEGYKLGSEPSGIISTKIQVNQITRKTFSLYYFSSQYELHQ